MNYILSQADPTQGMYIEPKVLSLVFEDLFCDIDDKSKKVKITYNYILDGEEMVVIDRIIKLMEPFLMSDIDVRLSYDICMEPMTEGYSVSYTNQILIVE